MRKIILASILSIAAAVMFLQSKGHSAETRSTPLYEYATVRFMGGGRTSFVWPDGKVEKLSDLNPLKRPDTADERMFFLTIAMNILAKRGFEPIAMPSLETHSDDIWTRRLVSPAN